MRAYVVDNHYATRGQKLKSLFHFKSRVAGSVQAVVNEEINLNDRAKERK